MGAVPYGARLPDVYTLASAADASITSRGSLNKRTVTRAIGRERAAFSTKMMLQEITLQWVRIEGIDMNLTVDLTAN